MIGVYNYTVILTYIGMLTGFSGIITAANGNIKRAVICLIFAGVCDMLDGRIAATKERTRSEKQFGIQIDSLSDLVSFGILPAMILYQRSTSHMILIPCSLYVLGALIRLAWYNVDEAERQDREDGPRCAYCGLPVTFAAVIFPTVIILCAKFHWPVDWIGSVTLLLTTTAFVTPFRVRKPVPRSR